MGVQGANAIVLAYRRGLVLDERFRLSQTVSGVAGAAMKRVGLGSSSSSSGSGSSGSKDGGGGGQENTAENAADT